MTAREDGPTNGGAGRDERDERDETASDGSSARTASMTAPRRPDGAQPALEIVFVVARARNGVIGAAGALPWRLPGELKRFRQTTWGHPLIMGRKTFQSIGKPLPGRDTIVLTHDAAFHPPGVDVAHGVDEAIARAETCAAARGVGAAMVVGGAQIYAAFTAAADRILLTEVELAPWGDAWFPTPDAEVWARADLSTPPAEPGDEARYAIHTYVRRHPRDRR